MITTKAYNICSHNKDNKLIVYGASVYGEIAFWSLKEIGVTPDYFCDKSIERKKYFGIEVIHPDELQKYQGCADIIIASADFFCEIKSMLEERGFLHLYDMSELLAGAVVNDNWSPRAKEIINQKYNYFNMVSFQNEKKINFNRIQYVVTEKCSLRCKDCSHLIPYYSEPQDIVVEEYQTSFENLLKCVDSIAELRIIGGEPFLSDETINVMSRYSFNEKIRETTIYSNGTIIPSTNVLDMIKETGTKVRISNYGINEKQIKNLVSLLKERKIDYFVRKYDEWQNPGLFEKRDYSNEELKGMFTTCFEHNGYSFLRGRLYRCPRSAHAINLKAIPNIESDYVDFQNFGDDLELLKNKITKLRSRDWLESCRFCDGSDNHKIGIPAGVQSKEKMTYKVIGEDYEI